MMSMKLKNVMISVLCICLVIIWCEFFIYYAVIFQCNWPSVNSNDKNVDENDDTKYVKVMLLADTHLLGRIKGHWFDKIRRHHQMSRAFQTSIQLLAPDMIIILGDIFDEGQWATDEDFDSYVRTFHEIFYVDESKMRMFVVVGNHDIGFHYWTDRYLRARFDKTFNTSSVDVIDGGNDVYFVRINSIALERDKCYFCSDAEMKLKKVAAEWAETKRSPPIVLMHFPMYRESESVCNEPDSAPEEEKQVANRIKFDCLSKDATHFIFDVLKPRLVFSGHSHHSCFVVHENSIQEWTVASFSWRNKKNPSFLLAKISSNHYSISKCFMPNENTVYAIYSLCLLLLVLFIIYTIRKMVFKHKLN